MKHINQTSKALCFTLALVGTATYLASCSDTAYVEAVSSASQDRRNLIGIEITTASPVQKADVGCRGNGVYVNAVIPNHPAHIAGLKPHDIITKIDDNPVEDMSNAIILMNGLEAGRRYPFEVCRRDKDGIKKLELYVLVEKVQESSIGRIS